MRPSSTSNKGYDLLHLQTNKVVNCRKIWSMPVTTSVIQQVHALARMDNMPNGLKITNKTGPEGWKPKIYGKNKPKRRIGSPRWQKSFDKTQKQNNGRGSISKVLDKLSE